MELPKQCIVTSDITKVVFPNDLPPEELLSRVILTPTNKVSLDLNEKILDRVLPGNCRVMHSADSVLSDDPSDPEMYPIDFLNSLTPTGMPQHNLKLKVGAIVMLLRNFDLKAGLTNGTRLKVLSIHRRVLKVEILCGFNAGKIHFLPKIVFQPSDSGLPFVLKRIQFPVRLAYCMTINKSQDQTFKFVGLYLEKLCFSHGQLYVGSSRTGRFKDFAVSAKPHGNSQGVVKGKWYTTNVVMQAVLQAAGVKRPSPMSPTGYSTSKQMSPRTPVAISVRRAAAPNSRPPTVDSIASTLSSMSLGNDGIDFEVQGNNVVAIRRTGLVNPDNTCYVNSILQVLYNVRNFWGGGQDVLPSSVLNGFQTFVNDMCRVVSIYPTAFVDNLVEIMPLFENMPFNAHQQQDACEILTYLLDHFIHLNFMQRNHVTLRCHMVLQCSVCSTSVTRSEVFNILSLNLVRHMPDSRKEC